MKKSTCKTLLLLLIYALALNPLSVVLADSAGDLSSTILTKHCQMQGKAHENSMNMDDALSSMKMAEKSGCECNKDCQQEACAQQCAADCGHFFTALLTLSVEIVNNQFTHNKITSELQHQLPILMHYRPPITLHS